MALVIQHRSAPVRFDPPVDVEKAKAAMQEERAQGLAQILAEFDGVDWWHAPAPVQAHYLKWGWIALQGAGVGKGQFSIVAVGLHMAAQAAHDCDAQLNLYTGVDLLAEQHTGERQHWYKVADCAVQAYLRHLGKQDEAVEHVFGYAKRMGL